MLFARACKNELAAAHRKTRSLLLVLLAAVDATTFHVVFRLLEVTDCFSDPVELFLLSHSPSGHMVSHSSDILLVVHFFSVSLLELCLPILVIDIGLSHISSSSTVFRNH